MPKNERLTAKAASNYLKNTALTFDIPELAGISRETIELHLGLYAGYVKQCGIFTLTTDLIK